MSLNNKSFSEQNLYLVIIALRGRKSNFYIVCCGVHLYVRLGRMI